MYRKTQQSNYNKNNINFEIFYFGSACLGSNPGRTTEKKVTENVTFFYCF